MDYKMLLRESIKNLPESKRAARQPVSSYTTPDIYRLNYNESAYGPSPLALQALKEASERPNIYPDWFSVELKSDICGFSKLAVGKFATWDDWVNYDWLHNYENSFFTVNVNTHLRSSYLVMGTEN